MIFDIIWGDFMKIATTTGDFNRFLNTYQERINAVLEAGFKYIDLSLYTINKGDELLVNDNWQENGKVILEQTQKLGGEFVQAHSPGGNPIAGDSDAQILLDATIRSIDICGILGIPNIVVHAGMLKGINKEQFFEKNKEFFMKLFPAM